MAQFARGEIHAPHLIDYEVAGGLGRIVRDARVDPDAGRDALSRWSRLEVHRYPAGGLLTRIWALRDSVTAYDAAYVALAEALGCPPLTADPRLAAAPAPRCEVQVVPR